MGAAFAAGEGGGGGGGGGGEAALYYKQTFSSGKRSVELYLEPGQAIDTTPINALLATEERSKYGSTLQAYGGESGLTRISVCELNGDQDHRLTSDETTGLLRAGAPAGRGGGRGHQVREATRGRNHSRSWKASQ